jgi:hypothetical protein
MNDAICRDSLVLEIVATLVKFSTCSARSKNFLPSAGNLRYEKLLLR